MNNGKIKIEVIVGIILFILCLFIIYGFVSMNSVKKIGTDINTNNKETVPTKIVFPTKTQEEVKVISQSQTLEVEITGTKIAPKTLEVKVADQVRFINSSGKTIKIVGEGWGNFPLNSGMKMVQPFGKAGNYSYVVTGLDSPLTGEIVVK